MPLGALLDQWEVYRQYQGLVRAKTEFGIDEIMPTGF